MSKPTHVIMIQKYKGGPSDGIVESQVHMYCLKKGKDGEQWTRMRSISAPDEIREVWTKDVQDVGDGILIYTEVVEWDAEFKAY